MLPTVPAAAVAAKTQEQIAAERALKGLKLVSASLPHLSGLAHAVRIRVTRLYPVAAISESGLLAVHPRVFAEEPMGDLVFVLAHELLHLALDSFGRNGNADPRLANIAHDFIINDILREELGRDVPLHGLSLPGARRKSLESLVTELSQGMHGGGNGSCWTIQRRSAKSKTKAGKSQLQAEMEKAGLVAPESAEQPEEPQEQEGNRDEDMMSEEDERHLEPQQSNVERAKQLAKVKREAVRAANLHEIRGRLANTGATPGLSGGQGSGDDDGASEAFLEAVRTAYQPPWQLALQHWLDAVQPGPRSYARASRRNGGTGGSDDLILPGRKREGWTLHVILDTSGSMVDTLPRILGLLGSFCDAAGCTDIHILQCDVGVTSDEWIDPARLDQYRIVGYGGSDMGPAMARLMEDPEVAAVLVLTDGYIDYLSEEPPYAVLWGLVDGDPNFSPSYGTVVHVRS